jgi:plastocyanin
VRLAALVAIATVLLGACVDSDQSSPTAEDVADIDVTADVTITVDEDGYDPGDVEGEAGTVYLLVNDGEEPHSFTADDHAFDTGRMLPGEETTLVLAEPGTYPFHDTEEPDHEGELRVLEEQP